MPVNQPSRDKEQLRVMRHVKIFGLAVVAVFALGATAASSALANPVWESSECIEVAPHEGRWSSADCNQYGGEEKFALSPWLVLSASDAVLSAGTLKLTDSKGGLFGESVTIQCTGTDAGTVGPGSVDETTSITATECKTIEGTCPSPKAEALHLPWDTQLEEPNAGEVRDKIKSSGAGTPGWKVKCSILTDECTAETSTLMRNNEEEGSVEAEFESKSAKANCSRGGTGTGTVKGIDVNMSSVLGLHLRVS